MKHFYILALIAMAMVARAAPTDKTDEAPVQFEANLAFASPFLNVPELALPQPQAP
ncbi:hypothetical protein H9P43_009994 [Blastocladiella emersonii ATCC 22665]|nr:hypothetical protein H9P43_009989 [Blastocladiella emersonii ATCC 22665]KAI9149815.1 hypothetical protein H9P43_009994 [Blastocladiella emersonii ATCC 22665]